MIEIKKGSIYKGKGGHLRKVLQIKKYDSGKIAVKSAVAIKLSDNSYSTSKPYHWTYDSFLEWVDCEVVP